MKYWIITGTHFSQETMVTKYGRNSGYESDIIKNLKEVVKNDDVIIHLGDICWENHKHWNYLFCGIFPFAKKWLVLGNHDNKSMSWYLKCWDFVAESFTLDIYGKKIIFSHIPQPDTEYDYNIHGHLHDNDHRKSEPEISKILTKKHKLISIEQTNYKPLELEKLIRRYDNEKRAKQIT
jgi:calcineurin-like phosphoesterase family protein